MPSIEEIERRLNSMSAIDRLATVEHERWAHWQRYVHNKGVRQDDGSLIIPADLIERWEHQIRTSYSELTTEEKMSDQDQVRRYLPAVVEILAD